MPRWHLYMIRTRDGALYTGIATDVARRFAEHQAQGERCARYLRGRAPLRLVFESSIGDRTLAHRVEYRMKRLPKREKEAIVRRKPDGTGLLAQLAIAPGGEDVL
jgi:putative endonuclease